MTFALSTCEQIKSNRTILGKSYARQELEIALTDKDQHNSINNNSIIKDSLTVICVAEPILFSMFGKENIVNQRPYEIYFINKYWIINGTLPKNQLGGTFLVIIDAKDSKIIRITHGK